jgi:hypothetical protein
MRTLEEIKEALAEQFDEVDILDMLGVNSFTLVNRFSDLIEGRIEFFAELVEDDIDET